ncbi:MAG: DUF2797 domain-containing protein [Gammaproteobacteria bacterium]|nr:DUF2797 domain-containing protein [Gammaproteobacteria bacterium]
MKLQGNLAKMVTEATAPVSYRLELGGQSARVNDWLGARLRIEYLQQIECIHCGRKTSKSFNQGYCYPCFRSLAQCDQCIMSPEKCHFHLGTCREPDWAMNHCMRPHIVYLSNTSSAKVGITRETQLPTRWIDQGAVRALPVLRVSQRYHAGLIEDAFRVHVGDRTNWRNMLKHLYEEVDLYAMFQSTWPQVRERLDAELLADAEEIAAPDAAVELEYPALTWPQKIVSFNLDKQPVVEGELIAVKGQYLILDSGVINIRKYGGYLVSIDSDAA